MLNSRLAQFILNRPDRIAMPIGVYAGLEMTGASVRSAVSDADAQSEAVLALHAALKTSFLLTAMDLSAEAEEFGCEVRMDDKDIPTVLGRRVTNRAEIDDLPVPQVGTKRTRVHLESAHKLSLNSGGCPVLGGIIGPFSLAGRLFGVSQVLELTITEPGAMHALLEKTTRFLIEYTLAFREAGAWGVIMAEPAAGLLSPRSLAAFSAAYVRRIAEEVQTPEFSIVYHNCGAKIAHLPKIMESNLDILHFGTPMDIPAALVQVDGKTILAGNLDPTAVFFNAGAEEVQQKTAALLNETAEAKNYILSSGCDIPPGTKLANMKAFFQALAEFNQEQAARA